MTLNWILGKLWVNCELANDVPDELCGAASGRMQLKKKTPTRPSIQQLQGGMSAMGLQENTSR